MKNNKTLTILQRLYIVLKTESAHGLILIGKPDPATYLLIAYMAREESNSKYNIDINCVTVYFNWKSRKL